MFFEVKIRNSLFSNEIKVLKSIKKEKSLPDEIIFLDKEFTENHTVAFLTVSESDNGTFWCQCEMASEHTARSPKSISEMKWNYGGFPTVESAINAGTMYALKRAGILFSIERKD